MPDIKTSDQAMPWPMVKMFIQFGNFRIIAAKDTTPGTAKRIHRIVGNKPFALLRHFAENKNKVPGNSRPMP